MLDWPEQDIERLTSCKDPVSLLYRQGLIPMSPSWKHRFQIHPEFDELSSIVDYLREIREKAPSDFSNTSQDWIPSSRREAERKWPMPLPGGKDWNEIMSAASGPAHYRSERLNNRGFVYGPEGQYSPFMTGFERYGQFGFAFWDYKRLWEYGFKAPPKYGPKSRNHIYYFAWQSILSIDEIEEVDRKSKRFQA